MNNKTELLCNKAITDLQTLLAKTMQDDPSKAAKLAYWFSDYANMINQEAEFNARKLKKYKRGDIVKAHLGFRIGSEQGGLHYCIILDNNNNVASPTVTVIPLTSIKPTTNISNLGDGRVYLGTEIFDMLYNKSTYLINHIFVEVCKVSGQKLPPEESLRLKSLMYQAKKTKADVQSMKAGSIALINQIVTISKIRIYDPLSAKNTLHGIRVSDETLNIIDEKIKKLYTKQ